MHTGYKQATAKFIASWILPKLKQQPDYRPSAMVIDFKTEFGIDIEYSKANRGKERVLEMIHRMFEARTKLCHNIVQISKQLILAASQPLNLLPIIDLNVCSSLPAPVQ